MDSWQYCQQTLPLVSRTFALNIRVFTGDLYRTVLIGYLICRILDTVEDSPSLEPTSKISFLRRFPSLTGMKREDGEELLSALLKDLKGKDFDGRKEELDLVYNSHRVLSCFHRLPPPYRRITIEMAATMGEGMAKFLIRFPDGNIRLQTVDDLERYCYCVAGVVGEFLCHSFRVSHHIPAKKFEILQSNCVSFGLGLQMTNIAKDIYRDARRGQTFVPESILSETGLSHGNLFEEKNASRLNAACQKLLREARGHLFRGHLFTRALPRRHLRLRVFCIRPLWMAFETLEALEKNTALLRSGQDVKISRSQVSKILLASKLIAPSNLLLDRVFSRYRRQ